MRTIPVIITTLQALVSALEDRPPLLYIDDCLLQSSPAKVSALQPENAYRRHSRGKHGVFYLRRDIHQVTIHDPMGIL